jgi:hypothetical protein
MRLFEGVLHSEAYRNILLFSTAIRKGHKPALMKDRISKYERYRNTSSTSEESVVPLSVRNETHVSITPHPSLPLSRAKKSPFP